ncbi:hypothetical protein [Chitinophaga sp. sic0106]|uniref:hypothetical protein n=1 Tax=Chitinophaga sp. sic0106 TaxID=2854785 RepID=UPI001C43C2C5|nr:hypothetical protein [Chitinophaga sp. sic0106]MBV7530989.1 hypothetical protein [Chitinophaga sp. sic0106]
MNKEYDRLLLEVSGELGEGTKIENSTHPPIVNYLHFIFNGWLGNELIECFHCYLVTDTLQQHLHDS